MPTVLITGTSSGIGEQTALYLLNDPEVKVYGVARRPAPASLSGHSQYVHIQGDATDSAVVDKIAKTVGPKLDGVVFNAGILDSVARIANTDLDAFRHVLEVNVVSVVALSKALIPALRAAHGRAIYVSSGASTNGYTAWGAYGASKAALNLVVSTIASEEPDITAVSVAPGVVDTQMQTEIRENHVGGGEMSKAEADKFLSLKSSNKLVDPRDSGKLYGHLALHAKPQWSGKYYRYDDPELAS